MKTNELIKEVKGGNIDAYRHIVRQYAPEIRAYIALRITDPHTVDDLVQEVMTAAYWNLKKFKMNSGFGAWVQGIAKNKFKEYLRSCNTHKESVIRNSVPIIEYLDSEFTESDDRLELSERLKDCISKLPQKYQEITKNRYMEKVSVQKIAENNDTTVSAISNSLYRIKKQLRLCIGGLNHV